MVVLLTKLLAFRCLSLAFLVKAAHAEEATRGGAGGLFSVDRTADSSYFAKGGFVFILRTNVAGDEL